MSGVTPCAPEGVTGTLVTTAALCNELDKASKVELTGPSVTAPTLVTDDMMPAALKKAMTDCTGTSSCKFIAYDFDSDVATKATASRYVVDTYSTTAENSGILVSKGKKTTGTVSGVTPDATTGGSTGTVTYTADNGQAYTFQGKWRSVQTNGASVDVYFDPANTSKGALRPEDLGIAPPMLVQPPGYELPDFQAASTTGSNLISRPDAASVEECAKKCDETDTCTGFNFGGLDTSSICELVKDTTTNRAYADGMSGFRKETISSTQTGDGSNPSGTDLTNEGVYCRDAQACNTDIARIITDNVGSTNPIATLSTSDIESCAYCPIRTYATAGNVTTNEIGVSKSNPTPAAAITELQYSADGTFASHLTITAGRWYKVSFWKAKNIRGSDSFYETIMCPIATSTPRVFNLAVLTNNKLYIVKNFWTGSKLGYTMYGDFSYIGGNNVNMNCVFTEVDYVTNGFIMGNDIDGLLTSYYDSTIGVLQKKLTTGRLTSDYNNGVLIFSEYSLSDVYRSIAATTITIVTNFVNRQQVNQTYTNPMVYINSNNEKFKLELENNQIIVKRFYDDIMLAWYLETNPSWSNSPFLRSYRIDEFNGVSDVNPQMPPRNQQDFIFTIFQTGPDMTDPYAALNQFRTLDVAPPSTAQAWSYDRRQGCDKNCGNIPNGYAIYKCTAAGGGNCDPGKGASVSGSVCSDTRISCRPTDDSADLKAQFSFKFRGLLPASTKVTGGGSNSDHNTDALRISTIYSLDSAFSVNVTPNESIQKIYSIFPQFVIDRILRTPGLTSLVPAAKCSAGTYVKDYGFGIKGCDACPGSPVLEYNQVFQPDTANPGNFMCTVTTCPTGQVRDLITNRCRIPCQPGQFIAADGSCGECPDKTLAINQYWMPDNTNMGSYTCGKQQCDGNQYVNATKSGCLAICFQGYGPDPANPSQCTRCTLTPTRLQTWVSDAIESRYTCALTTCPDGQYPFTTEFTLNRSCTPCSQPTGLPTGVTVSFGQGCAVKACSVDPNSAAVASATFVAPTVTPPANCGIGGCTPVGSCSLVCRPGFTGPSCSPCPQPPGIIATYSTACIATACSVDTSSADASKVNGVTLTNGNCIVSCAPRFWKYLEYGCYACGARTGDDPLTTRTYASNSCDPASCTVDASLIGKATAAPATVPGTNTSVCMLTPAKGYGITSSTDVTGDYISIAGPFDFRTMSFTRSAASAFSTCPTGDAGTTYTYSSGCTLATCSYTNPNDANETASSLTSSNGYAKCTKVCKAGYKRDASGKCTVVCPQPSDLGLTATFTYGCKISTCTSSSGFPTSVTSTGAYGTDAYIYGDICTIACPAGARQYTNTNVSPIRQDCAKCTSDYSLNPWIFTSTCSLITNYCTTYGPIFQRKLWSPGEGVTTATATQSGSTCTTACTSGYVKDSNGVCRKCPNETPSSTSAVVNGVCVTTCKANHTRDVTYDAKESDYSTQQRFDPLFGVRGRTGPVGQLDQSEIVCPQCINGTTWDTASLKCINCSQAATASTVIQNAYGGCTQTCKPGYIFNKATGSCDACPGGYYCPGGMGSATTSTQCGAGTYCPVGSTTTTPCSAGYSCPAGSGSATSCNLTPATGYIWSNPGVDCTTKKCPAGYYCPNGTTQTACSSGNYCPEGSGSQSACPSGSYCPTTATSATCSTTACGSGTYMSAACSSTSDRVCSNCRLPCVYAGGEYEASPCTATADRTCGTCSTSCPAGQWQSAACSTTANRVCSACTTCSAGQWQQSDCTATANRVCKTCTTCPAGQWQSAACTATADTVCLGCSACGANSTRTGCGGTSAGSCVCNSGYSDFGNGVCYKIATYSYTCVSGYTLSGTTCYGTGGWTQGQGRGATTRIYYCPSGTPTGVTVTKTNCASNLTNCCSYPAVGGYTCPSGGTATLRGSNYYCV